MNKNGLEKLLALGETETLEFKQSLTESFYETTSAFSNARVGITGKGANYTLKTPQRRQTIRKIGLIPILTDGGFSLNQAAPRHKKNCPDIGHHA